MGENDYVPEQNNKEKKKVKKKSKRGEKKFKTRILAVYFITYNRVLERGEKGLKNYIYR